MDHIKTFKALSKYLSRILPTLTLVINLVLIIGYFFYLPYYGFDIIDGKVVMDCSDGESGLVVDDKIVAINQVNLSEYRSDIKLKFTDIFNSGSTNSVELIRNNETLNIELEELGWTSCEFKFRMIQPWLNGVVFWLAGFIYFTTIKPGNHHSLLLGTSFLLSSLWLIAGGTVSALHILFSAEILRFAGWLTLPILIHFHTIFPNKLKIPNLIIWLLYMFSFGIGLVEIFGILDFKFFYIGYYVGIPLIIILIIMQIRFHKDLRSIALLLLISLIFATAPSFGMAIFRLLFGTDTIPTNWATLFSLPILPIGYISAVNLKSPSTLRFDSNKFITPYLFVILIASFTMAFHLVTSYVFKISPFTTGLTLSVMISVLSIVSYPRFREFIDERLLGIPWSLEKVVSRYSEALSTSDNTDKLANIIQNNVLPSFQIKESVIYTRDKNEFRQILIYGISIQRLPKITTLKFLFSKLRQTPYLDFQADKSEWFSLIIPLVAQNELVGMWLIGSKESTLSYSKEEIQFIRSIAHQTAVALSNISRSKLITELYRFNINRQEAQSKRIARDLHDEVLNEIVVISMELDTYANIEDAHNSFHKLSEHVRGLISGLRPSMLDYGLHTGLEELKSELDSRITADIKIKLMINSAEQRPDPNIEEHIFRIIQQAIENVYRHSGAKNMDIYGYITEDNLEISVKDNGIGFRIEEDHDLTDYIQAGHYGIAGMFERAALIDAKLTIDTSLGKGTTVKISWIENQFKA